ncbi:gibberellin 20-oxidase-like protein [Tasmannia lanceolata]|uniref:gibberellin 20-oxidase-like protein n=1 Tax=Tasmannia lanceolata TaxID=3420 RepID=UPI0040636423
MSESHTSLQLPILDLSQPLDPSSLSSLSKACHEWGFFHITNHGISKDLFNNLHSLSNLLFSLPSHTKFKLGPSSALKTYTPHFIASPFFESFRISGPDFFGSTKSSTNVLFDPPKPEFCDILQEYGSKVEELSKRIIEILLISMGDGFERKYFEPEFSSCHGYLRIINYTSPKSFEDGDVEGLGMHTDMSCITIVDQDQIGGLQVKTKEGNWMDINPLEGTLVVNIGDLLQAWSNGRLRSSEHRVVLRRPMNRLSLAFFWCFQDEKVICAPEEVVGEGKPRIYKPFVCLDYIKFRENFVKGKFERVGFTVNDFATVGTSNGLPP